MHKLVQVTGLFHLFDQDMFAAPQALYSLSSRPTTQVILLEVLPWFIQTGWRFERQTTEFSSMSNHIIKS